MTAEYPVILFDNQAEWEEWLEVNHAGERGVWLRIAKKASTLESVTYADAVESGLCFGWIDGQGKSFDAESYLQKFTPRGRRSIWSKINREKADALIAAGRMRPAGQAAIDSARADGRWDRAYDSSATATVPADFQAALDAVPAARAFFDQLKAANRYAMLFRIQTAVKPATRARRIEQFVEMLARGEAIHPH